MSLSAKTTIQKLQIYSQSSFPILSVYLPLSAQDHSPEKLTERFHALIASSLSPGHKKSLRKDVAYIEGFLKKYTNRKDDKTLIIFSGNNQLWEIIHSKKEFDAKAVVAHTPFLYPLEQKAKTDRRFLIVLADREKAKMFTIYKGVLEDQKEVFDNSVPQKVRINEEGYYGREDKVDRHIKDHLHKHFSLIGERVHDFAKNKQITGVIIGGHKTIMHAFAKELPDYLRGKIMGEFISELNVSMQEIMQKSKAIVSKLDQELRLPNVPLTSA